jgi:hypothetical protein
VVPESNVAPWSLTHLPACGEKVTVSAKAGVAASSAMEAPNMEKVFMMTKALVKNSSDEQCFCAEVENKESSLSWAVNALLMSDLSSLYTPS